MRLIICLIPLLCACSTPAVRCDAHLQPINQPRRAKPPAGGNDCRRAEHAVITVPAIEEYFRQGESWDADRAAQYRRGARTAWWVAGAGWLCAIATATALALLMPLKRVDPFVVRVDNTTGIVDVVPVYAGRATAEEAVTRYFLTHYLTVCERFNFATAESDYEECGAFHSAQRNQAWYALWTATNPASPLNVHKDGSTVRVQVSSVSFFTPIKRSLRSGAGAVLESRAPRRRSRGILHALGGDGSIRILGAGERSEDAPLESARLQDRRFSIRTRSFGRTTGGEGARHEQ